MRRKHEICTMQILVIAATEAEIAPFIYTNSHADVLVTGVGVPSTLYHLQKRISQADYDCIIQAGIAGSFDAAYSPGSVTLVQQDCFADIGIEEKENYTPIFNTSFADKDQFPFAGGWLINPHDLLSQSSLLKVTAVTVNKVSDRAVQTQQLIHHFNPHIESMEGAALHYVCLQEKIPFIQLRAVSNYVGERDKSQWKIKEAIQNLDAELQLLINQLTR